jgi:hypothetical protein
MGRWRAAAEAEEVAAWVERMDSGGALMRTVAGEAGKRPSVLVHIVAEVVVGRAM